jgi:hypothetical protein
MAYPPGWQLTRAADSAAHIDAWRPGDGLGAVMGAPGPFDALDIDPGNNGD